MILHVGIAQYKVGFRGDTLKVSALGSCLGLVVVDERQHLSGVAHILLPEPRNGRAVPAGKFVVSAVPALLKKLETAATHSPVLQAKLVGGANMFGQRDSESTIGYRNVEACRVALRGNRIRMVAEDVGGEYARTVEVDAGSGVVRVTSHKGVLQEF